MCLWCKDLQIRSDANAARPYAGVHEPGSGVVVVACGLESNCHMAPAEQSHSWHLIPLLPSVTSKQCDGYFMSSLDHVIALIPLVAGVKMEKFIAWKFALSL